MTRPTWTSLSPRRTLGATLLVACGLGCPLPRGDLGVYTDTDASTAADTDPGTSSPSEGGVTTSTSGTEPTTGAPPATTSSDTLSTEPADTGSSTTSEALPTCDGLTKASCMAQDAGDIAFECRWINTTVVEVVDGRCEVLATPSRCVKHKTFELDGCQGYFQVVDDGVEVWLPVDCGQPIDAGFEFCSPQDGKLENPACVCIDIGYCFSQPDEAACVAASNSLWTCAWNGVDKCWPAS